MSLWLKWNRVNWDLLSLPSVSEQGDHKGSTGRFSICILVCTCALLGLWYAKLGKLTCDSYLMSITVK